MQGNIIGQDISGNSSLLSNLNIFTQPNEPSEKNGIWVQTPTDYEYENIQFVQNLEPNNPNFTEFEDVDYNVSSGYMSERLITSVGTNIYILGGKGSGSTKYDFNYRYDTLTSTYERMNDVPEEFAER